MARQELGNRRRGRPDSDDDFEVELERGNSRASGHRMQSSPHIGVTKVSQRRLQVS